MDPTNSLRQARWRARRAAELARLRADNAALRQELAAAAQARIAELEKTGAAKPQRPRRRKAPARRKSGNGR